MFDEQQMLLGTISTFSWSFIASQVSPDTRNHDNN